MKWKQVKAGEVFLVPLSDGSAGLGKITWRSASKCATARVFVAFYKRVEKNYRHRDQLSELTPFVDWMMFASHIGEKRDAGWPFIGSEPVLEKESEWALREHREARYVYSGDKHVRYGTDSDMEHILERVYMPPFAIVRDLHKLFGIPQVEVAPVVAPIVEASYPWETAVEWVDALKRSRSLAGVKKALSGVVSAEHAEFDECHDALAAAEVVAALRGHPQKHLPVDIVAWVKKLKATVEPGLLELARQALERVCTKSELQEEWDENEDVADWKKAAQDLRKRLNRG